MTFDVTAKNRYTQRLPRLCYVSQMMQMADAYPHPAGQTIPECCLGAAGGVLKVAEGCRSIPKHSQGCRYTSLKYTEAVFLLLRPHITEISTVLPLCYSILLFAT